MGLSRTVAGPSTVYRIDRGGSYHTGPPRLSLRRDDEPG